MPVMTLGSAIALGVRALARESWLVAVGLLVGILRRATLWPAWAVAVALLARAALLSASRRPLDLAAPVEGMWIAASSPRFVAVVVGLWLAGVALGAALRVAFMAGALPTLAASMSGARREPRFASGIAGGFARVLAAAMLGFVLDVAGSAFGWALALAALEITVHAIGNGGSVALAAAVAGALTLALVVPLALAVIADAAVARAALREEGPGTAFAASGARFLARPGTFLLASIAFTAVGAAAPAAVEAFGGTLTGFAAAHPLVLAGPELVFAVVALGVTAALDLWWLGTVAALACGEAGS